ncbi:hypothetical protein SLEP1_g10160 [Rubroshorea leprosula]|uniref:Transposase n=1 Tax=Rubroshorea leprosula TaxID=152421 RepID=A0AAV5IF58_9ROSI|nr:hypothetical protein SLEP1_g10160 [Rubroshorea leprosula]
MVYDAFCPSENDRHRNETEFASENVGDAPNNNAQSFYDLLRASTIPLGPASNNQTLFGWLSYMLHTKAKNNISGVGYNEIIHGYRKLLSPEDQQKVPSNFYEAKKFMKSLGLGYVKIDACVNNCFLYYGDKAKSLTACPVCGEPRYKRRNSAQTGKKDRPRNSLWYLPIIPRLQRLYMSRKTVEHMTWHLKSDPRNVQVGLATDGFNPWGHSSKSYFCWPVLIVVYNLPPKMCMRPEFTFLTLVISGPKSPGKNIDVFLRPLIDDLKRLWSSRVETFDSFRKQNFTMRVMLMWTITDFPSYGMVSGWSTHGRLSCPYCMEMTRAFYLQNGRKISFFDCHRQFLPASHSYRMDTTHFLKSRFEFGPPSPRLDGHSIRLRVPDVLFGNPSVNQTIFEFGETHNWVKQSIFWELPYWEDNLIRHNLDVMHCEKNFFDNIIHTVMDDLSSKDNVKSRMDLPLYCDREALHLYYDRSGSLCKPNASYALNTDKKRCRCTWLKHVRFPDGFASNIARCVNLTELRLVGLKSHDCHIFMQRLIPIAFRGLLLDSIWGLLTEHLAIHLPFEARMSGLVQFRWMYPFERQMHKLKQTIGNKNHVEAFIVEAYILNEITDFCSRYFGADVETSWSKPPRNFAAVPLYRNTEFSIFACLGHPMGSHSQTRCLTTQEMKAAELYVLLNCREVDALLSIFDREVGVYMTPSDPQKARNRSFVTWFKDRVLNGHHEGNEVLQYLALGPSWTVNVYRGTTISDNVETDYYGILNEVIELLYYGPHAQIQTIVLFNCDWFDTRKGTHINQVYDIVEVNPQYRLSTGESFCLVCQSTQVYYTSYPSDNRATNGWFAACKIRARHLIDTCSTSLDIGEIFQDEEPPSTQSLKHNSNLASTECVDLHAEGATMVDLNGNASEGNDEYETRSDAGGDSSETE